MHRPGGVTDQNTTGDEVVLAIDGDSLAVGGGDAGEDVCYGWVDLDEAIHQ